MECIPKIRVANAPCSWGTLEFDGLEGHQVGYRQMLDELVETGYAGTELGDWGYMPTEPSLLRQALQSRKVTMVGAFIPVAFRDAATHARGTAHALRVARLLASVATPDHPPFIVLADDNGTDPTRTRHAGRITSAMALSDEEWGVFAGGVEQIARTIRDETGLPAVFHHHCAGYIETPAEIERLLDLTDPDLVGLVFDTGHYVFGAGSEGCERIVDDLRRFGERVWHVHFKDCDPAMASRARHNEWDYFESLRQGIFCELGQGCVDFRAVRDWLNDQDFRGWIVVEQDVLPGMGTPRQSALRNRAYLKEIGL